MAKKFKQIIFIIVALLIGSFLLFFVIARQKPPANNQQPKQSSLKVAVNSKEKELNSNKKINPQSLENEKYPSEKENPQLKKTLHQLAETCEKQPRILFQQTIFNTLKTFNLCAQDIPTLSKLLDSDTTDCQNYIAVVALNKINDENIIIPLIKFIENPLINPESKYDAVRVLAKFNNDQAADAIAKRMNKTREKEQLRIVSALSLGEMLKSGNEKALDYLIKGINTITDIGIEYKCIQALENAQSNIQQKQVIPPLLENLNTTQNKDIKIRTLKTLGYFHNDQVINILIKTVENSDDAYLRTVAVWALKRIGDPVAIDCIKEASQDDNEYLSNAAQKALDSMLKK